MTDLMRKFNISIWKSITFKSCEISLRILQLTLKYLIKIYNLLQQGWKIKFSNKNESRSLIFFKAIYFADYMKTSMNTKGNVWMRNIASFPSHQIDLIRAYFLWQDIEQNYSRNASAELQSITIYLIPPTIIP